MGTVALNKFPIQSMYFRLMKRKLSQFIFILKINSMQQLLVAFSFHYDLGKTMKTTKGCTSNNFYTYGKKYFSEIKIQCIIIE